MTACTPGGAPARGPRGTSRTADAEAGQPSHPEWWQCRAAPTPLEPFTVPLASSPPPGPVRSPTATGERRSEGPGPAALEGRAVRGMLAIIYVAGAVRKPESAGWPWVITHPGLPQIRTCPTKAYGSSRHGTATDGTPSGPPPQAEADAASAAA